MSKTNWNDLKNLSEEEILSRAKSDPDAQPTTELMWQTADELKILKQKANLADIYCVIVMCSCGSLKNQGYLCLDPNCESSVELDFFD